MSCLIFVVCTDFQVWLLTQVLQCEKDRGVETGVDIDDFISFLRKPGLPNPNVDETQTDLIQKTLEEFIKACEDKSLSEVVCTQ